MSPSPRDIWHFDTTYIGRRAHVFDQIDSTNSLAMALAAQEETDGLVLIANEQTAGRGQYGRCWESAPDRSLLASVILHPPPDLRRATVLTAWAAVAVSDAIDTLIGQPVRIKWPNDLLLQGKKVCGILIEQRTIAERVVAVVGIGLNLTQTADEFAAANLPEATSLALASGNGCDQKTAAAAVIRALDRAYRNLLCGESVMVEASWKWRVGLLGQPVSAYLYSGEVVSGRLRDLTFHGLELTTADGFARVLVPEAVSHLRLEPNFLL